MFQGESGRDVCDFWPPDIVSAACLRLSGRSRTVLTRGWVLLMSLGIRKHDMLCINMWWAYCALPINAVA